MAKLTIERSIWINASRERVWQALNEPEQLAQWFAPGLTFIRSDNRVAVQVNGQVVEVAEVISIDPMNSITSCNLPGRTETTTYRLSDENGGTRVTVIESGYERLTEAERSDRLLQNGDGWERALENLKAFIDGKDLPTPEGF